MTHGKMCLVMQMLAKLTLSFLVLISSTFALSVPLSLKLVNQILLFLRGDFYFSSKFD